MRAKALIIGIVVSLVQLPTVDAADKINVEFIVGCTITITDGGIKMKGFKCGSCNPKIELESIEVFSPVTAKGKITNGQAGDTLTARAYCGGNLVAECDNPAVIPAGGTGMSASCSGGGKQEEGIPSCEEDFSGHSATSWKVECLFYTI